MKIYCVQRMLITLPADVGQSFLCFIVLCVGRRCFNSAAVVASHLPDNDTFRVDLKVFGLREFQFPKWHFSVCVTLQL